ncbi:MAG: isochorismatase family cysteine hydrolase [Cyanobacteria bacterium J06621_12]
MVDFNLGNNSTALLIIDFQADFLNGSSIQIVGTDEVLPKAKKVLATAREIGLPIIHTQEVHRQEMVDFGRELDGAEPVHCLETWAGTDFYSDLYPRNGEFAIAKRRYSCFFGTDLEILLRGLKIDTLVIMGTLTNVCVHYTVAEAHQRDYYFYVIEDCCAGSDWDAHGAALKAMQYLQKDSLISSQVFIDAAKVSIQPV